MINEANTLLVESNVLADMEIEAAAKNLSTARNSRRTTGADDLGTIDKESFDNGGEQPELFSVMQHHLNTDGPSKPANSDAGDRIAAVPDTRGLPKMTPTPPTIEFIIPSGMAPEPAVQPLETGQPAVAATQSFQLLEGQTLQMVDQIKLMEILSNRQENLGAAGPPIAASTIEEVERLDI